MIQQTAYNKRRKSSVTEAPVEKFDEEFDDMECNINENEIQEGTSNTKPITRDIGEPDLS